MIDLSTFLMRGSRQYERLAMPGLVAILVAVLTVVVIIPQVSGAYGNWQEITKLKRELGTVKDKINTLTNLDGNTQANRVKKMTEAVPNSEDLGYFVLGLKAVAVNVGANLDSVDLQSTPKEEVGAGGAVEVAMEATVVGDLEKVTQFLIKVQQFVPLARIISVSLGSDGGKISGRVGLVYAYAPVPKELGEAGAALPILTAQDETAYAKVADLGIPETTTLPTVETGNTNLMY